MIKFIIDKSADGGYWGYVEGIDGTCVLGQGKTVEETVLCCLAGIKCYEAYLISLK